MSEILEKMLESAKREEEYHFALEDLTKVINELTLKIEETKNPTLKFYLEDARTKVNELADEYIYKTMRNAIYQVACEEISKKLIFLKKCLEYKEKHLGIKRTERETGGDLSAG